MIIDDIHKGQEGDQQAVLTLVQRFNPLLKKYARKLETEDAYYDLELEFLETVMKLNCASIKQRGDGAMVNYLSKCIRHSYIKLLHRLILNKIPLTSLDELTDQVLYQQSGYQTTSLTAIDVPESLLTKKEKAILYKVYIQGCSAAEVAKSNGTSRQNINQIKRRAEKKLRTYWEETGQF